MNKITNFSGFEHCWNLSTPQNIDQRRYYTITQHHPKDKP